MGALAAAESAASAAVETRPLRAAAFTTRVPAGWPVVAFATAGNALRAITGAWRWRTPVTGPRARPRGGARYLGATSQGEAIAVDRTSSSSARYAFAFFPACRAITIPGQQDVSRVAVGPSGRFEDRFDVAYRPFPDPAPVIAGRPRALLLVEKTTLTGRFASRDRATGTLRDRLGVFDRGAFPAPSAQLDACDTGPLTWRAGRF